MKLRQIFHMGARILRPLLSLLGVKPKTVVGKIPDVVEIIDEALPPERTPPPKP